MDRRLSAALALLAVTLPLASCGKTTLKTTVERRDVEIVRAVPEGKANSVRPRLTTLWDEGSGVLTISAYKELVGELHEVETWNEATVTVKGVEPDPVPYLFSTAMTVGLPLVFATVDDHFRQEAEKAFVGKELERKETVVARLGESGTPLGIPGTSRGPWPKARLQLVVEDKKTAEIVLDGFGRGTVKLAELISDPQPLLANEGLSVRVSAELNGTEAEASVYLTPAELPAFRSRVAAHAETAGRALLKSGDTAGAARALTVAAELGRPEAQVALAELHREGRGISQNFQEAARWTSRAAEQGNPEAQHQWAGILADRRDNQQAYLWALLASAQARDELGRRAVVRRDELARRLKPAEIEKAQAQAAIFRPAAEERPVIAVAQPRAESVPPLDAQRIHGKANSRAVALVIGVEDYEKLPPAQFAGRDARTFRDFAMEAMGIPRERVRVLLNQDARLLDVQRAIDTWLQAEIADGAEDVFVFFSGHGLASEDGRNLYLLPHDGDRALLARSGLDRAALMEAVLKAGAKSLTLFLDTCYSGGTRGTETLLADMRPLLIVPKESDVPGPAAIFAAAGGHQLSSAYAPARHGLFSYFLMRGMMGEADADSDRRLTLGELHRFTEEKVRRTALAQGRQQSPVLIGDADVVLMRW